MSNNRNFTRKRTVNSATIVDECFRISTQIKIDAFIQNEKETDLCFPSSLTKDQRAFVHVYVEDKDLKSKSHDKGDKRFITLYKKKGSTQIQRDAVFELSLDSQRVIYNLLKHYPLTYEETNNVTGAYTGTRRKRLEPCRFTDQIFVCVPPLPKKNDFNVSRESLPIFKYRQEIIDSIEKNQTLVISGETGSGKTTQVPQYILEDCATKKVPCRIICTQPRRLSAISVSERVALERNDVIGQTIGYQIRLESRVSSSSNLIYCTNGLFLRCLMGDFNQEIYKKITHIIVDEVHERDKHSDFLLISIREALKLNPHLKLILMSATMDSSVFTEYFGNCPLMNIPGRMFSVQQFYLEQILALTGFSSEKIEKFKRKMNEQSIILPIANDCEIIHDDQPKQEETSELDMETIELLNETMDACLVNEDEFSQFFYLVEGENVPVNFQNTKNGMTALMIAARKGYQDIIKKLLQLGADTKIVCFEGLNAIDWAGKMQQFECVAIISDSAPQDTTVDLNLQYQSLLLDVYQTTVNDETIDHYLIMKIINYIHCTQPFGSILIFLPGYDDIIEQNEIILTNLQQSQFCPNYEIYMLHSNMNLQDQKGVFRSPGIGCRKIVLSTNIAETSVTIEDIVYVIDSGKVKQKSFDAISCTTCLVPTWISQACATQRSGRAGRTKPGVCFKMYSKRRYDSMEKYTLPEILRVPLTEICLQSKLVAPNVSIADFLNRALQPPSPLSVKQSIALLISIGAITQNEQLTDLGLHLADLPVDAQLGKTLIYAILLKCLDPVLTIVSALSVKDPFVLPSQIADRSRAVQIKKNLSENAFSDHMSLLKVFQKWLHFKALKSDKKFCHQNFISAGNMETISGVRSQILGHLRAVGLVRGHGPGNIHDLNINSNNWSVVKACLVGALYPNVCRLDRDLGQLKSKTDKKILIHPSSILRNNKLKKDDLSSFPTDFVVYGEKTRVGRYSFIKTNTIVTPISIAFFSGTIVQNEKTSLIVFDKNIGDDGGWSDEDDYEYNNKGRPQQSRQQQQCANLVLDDWIKFTLDVDTAYMVFHLRQKLSALFLKFIHDPKVYFKIEMDSPIIKSVVEILSNEDRAFKLPQPSGIGDRPKAAQLNFAPSVNYDSVPENYNQINKISNSMSQTNLVASTSSNSSDILNRSNYNYDNKINVGRPITKNVQHHQQQQSQWNQNNNNNNNNMFGQTEQKYFIVKAASKGQVIKSLESNRWNFASSVFKFLLNSAKERRGCDFIIFFHVTTAQAFVGCAKFLVLRDGWKLEWISDINVTFMHASDVLSKFVTTNRSLLMDKCYDGEELSYQIGNNLMNIFIHKV